MFGLRRFRAFLAIETRWAADPYKTAEAAATGNISVEVKQKLFVANATGLPKRVQTLGDNDAVTMQLEYLDYDAPITITLPICK